MFLPRPGIAGINRAHPANRNALFSFVASGALGAFDRVTKQAGTLVTGTPTVGVTAWLGNTLNFAGAPYYSFANLTPAASPLNITLAAIVQFNTLSGSINCLVSTAGGFGGYRISTTGTGLLFVQNNVAGSSALVTLSAGVPYLVATSFSDSVASINALAVRLDTGAVSAISSAFAHHAANSTLGTWYLGAVGNPASTQLSGNLAAVLGSSTYLSLSELLQWSQDPWGPWRPNIFARDFLFSLSGGTYATSVSETGSAADTVSNVAALPSTLAETGSAIDAFSAQLIATGAVTEIGAATDTASNVAILPSSVSEAGTAADIISTIAILPSTVSETGAVIDITSSMAILPSMVVEAGNAQDVLSAATILNLTVAEAGAAADLVSAAAVLVAVVSELGVAVDQVSSLAVLQAAIAEFGVAVDIVTATEPPRIAIISVNDRPVYAISLTDGSVTTITAEDRPLTSLTVSDIPG